MPIWINEPRRAETRGGAGQASDGPKTMKLPNFRLYDTQARFSTFLGVLALIVIPPLAFLVFKTFDRQNSIIWYNAQAKGLTRFREPIIVAMSAAAIGIGVLSGVLGFNSLGQKRNEKQRLSWIGLALGALSVTGAALILFTWLRLKETTITS
jgi:hypothetical protein